MLIVLASCLLSACVSTAKMATPANASLLVEHKVIGANPLSWQKPLAFGRWHTIDTTDYGRVDGGIPIGKAVLGGTFHARALTTNDNIHSKCSGWLLNISRKSLAVDPTLGNMPLLTCTFSGPGNRTFTLKETYSNKLDGKFSTELGNFSVKSVHEFQGSPWPSAAPVGFHIYQQDTIVWSIDKLNAGAVMEWQALPDEQKNLLAALTMVLLVTDFENLLWEDL